jgi:hypothetical protein
VETNISEPGWPEVPTCHGAAFPAEWAAPRTDEPYGYEFRTCSYCNSIHPADLLTYLEHGASLSGADWKYAWPHKFYIENIPNPLADQIVAVGSEDGVSIMGPAPLFTWAKWYNSHLMDRGYSSENLNALLAALSEHSGIKWFVDSEMGLTYKAPYQGFQK